MRMCVYCKTMLSGYIVSIPCMLNIFLTQIEILKTGVTDLGQIFGLPIPR